HFCSPWPSGGAFDFVFRKGPGSALLESSKVRRRQLVEHSGACPERNRDGVVVPRRFGAQKPASRAIRIGDRLRHLDGARRVSIECAPERRGLGATGCSANPGNHAVRARSLHHDDRESTSHCQSSHCYLEDIGARVGGRLDCLLKKLCTRATSCSAVIRKFRWSPGRDARSKRVCETQSAIPADRRAFGITQRCLCLIGSCGQCTLRGGLEQREGSMARRKRFADGAVPNSIFHWTLLHGFREFDERPAFHAVSVLL